MQLISFIFKHLGSDIQCENLILHQNTYIQQTLYNKEEKGAKYDAKNKSCFSCDWARGLEKILTMNLYPFYRVFPRDTIEGIF